MGTLNPPRWLTHLFDDSYRWQQNSNPGSLGKSLWTQLNQLYVFSTGYSVRKHGQMLKAYHDIKPAAVSMLHKLQMKKRSERRKHCTRAVCSKVRTPPARPLSQTYRQVRLQYTAPQLASAQCNYV